MSSSPATAAQVAKALRALGVSVYDTTQVTIWLTPTVYERDLDNALLLRWRQERGWHLLRRAAAVDGPVISLGAPDTSDPDVIAAEALARLEAGAPGPSDEEVIARAAEWARQRAEAEQAAPPERRCKYCGARQGLVMIMQSVLDAHPQWRCAGEGCAVTLGTPVTWEVTFEGVGDRAMVPPLQVPSAATGGRLADELAGAIQSHVRPWLSTSHYTVNVSPHEGLGWIDGGRLGRCTVYPVSGGGQ